MATLLTDISTQQDATSPNPANRVEGNLLTGRKVTEIIKYTTTGAEANNDIIKLTTLWQGGRILVDECRCAGIALGGTSVVIGSLGTTTSANELATADIAVTAASDSAFTPIAGLPAWATKLAANTSIYALVTLSAAPVAGRDLYFRIAYILP